MFFWIMEVSVDKGSSYLEYREWRAVRPMGGKPYKYDNRLEAQNMRKICYGDCLPELTRIREVTQEEYDNLQ